MPAHKQTQGDTHTHTHSHAGEGNVSECRSMQSRDTNPRQHTPHVVTGVVTQGREIDNSRKKKCRLPVSGASASPPSLAPSTLSPDSREAGSHPSLVSCSSSRVRQEKGSPQVNQVFARVSLPGETPASKPALRLRVIVAVFVLGDTPHPTVTPQSITRRHSITRDRETHRRYTSENTKRDPSEPF